MSGPRRSARVMVLALGMTAPLGVPQADAQSSERIIPLARGLAIVSTLHDSGAERESVVTVEEVSAAGVRYVWRFIEVHASGDTIRKEFTRFVSRADLATAPRWHEFYEADGPVEHPGYTAFSLSTAVFRQLRAQGSDSFQIMGLDRSDAGALAQLGIRGRAVPIRWRGRLTRTSSSPEDFPLLINGRRVSVPALRFRGQFVSRQRHYHPEFWVLADSTHPLLLKVADSIAILQTIRVDLLDDSGPSDGAGAAGQPGNAGGSSAMIERELAARCRVEVPGVYFAFNSAVLDPASDRTIAALARTFARHPDWKATIEGHTDSIGSTAANQVLSERRAQAVRSRLVSTVGPRAADFGATGFGASRPRESNATIEGRARNRRVELVRDCGSQFDSEDRE